VSTPSLDQIASAVIGAFPKLSAPEQRAALALYRLLAKGRPVTAEQLSAASAVPGPAVHDMLAKWHGIQRSADGAVTAFWGLTLSKTKHRFRVDGRELHTWCAWDTLFLPPLLGAMAEVESACPVSGEVIRLRVGPRGVEAVHPDTPALSFVTPTEAAVERNVIESFCCHVHFFASAEAGKEWVDGHRGAFLLSLIEAWQIGVRKNATQYPVALVSG
jgi:alkylmercury lyase